MVYLFTISGGKYKLAPYEEIDHRTLRKAYKGPTLINYALLSKYEHQDNTQGKSEYACVGDKCEI